MITKKKMKLPNNKFLIEKLMKIRDKRGKQVPFVTNPAQTLYWEKRKRRNLILKARQKGISKFIDADQLTDCIKKPTNAVVVSHEQGATKRLFAAVRYYIDTMKVKPVTSIDSASEIKFPKRGSSYFIGTAGQKAFGRGDTVDRAHLSEAAFYYDLERILNGIAEAAEYGQIDIETTPNGREQFYNLWQAAKSGKSSYTPIFIPWFIDSEYSSENMTEKEKQGLSSSVQEMFALSDSDFIATLESDERNLIERVAREWNIILTPGQLKWRRAKIWDKGLIFFQEYPEDDVSCFLQSGRSVFTHITCDETKKIPLDDFDRWANDKNWSDRVKALFKNKPLYGGLDPAEGTPNGDSHSFSVLDVDQQTGKGTFIFDMTSNEPIDVFATKVAKIVDEFNIWMGVEKNGVGLAMCNKLESIGCRFSEWETTGVNRPIMITELEEAYRKGDIIETYPEAENQARDMEYNEKHRADHKKGGHDDRILSRAIALQMKNMPEPGVTIL